jgi:hypothetical protein
MKLLFKESYLAFIKNSRNSHSFRNFYADINGKTVDIVKGGKTSCAFFVSSVLLTFGLIKANHLTVDGLLKDMNESGWYLINKPLPGAILLWEEKLGHEHTGFFIIDKKAISNSTVKNCPIIHSFNYLGKRKIKAIYWHKRLEQNAFN